MYNILLRFIYFLSRFKFIYPKKYQDWFLAQKKILDKLKPNPKKTIWIHCSSLGEYEQIKPIIPELQKINPLINITFFSSSGYINFQDFELITQISYLPLDIESHMKNFIKKMNPMMVIISKNDIWPNMVTCITKNNIPLYSIGCKLNKIKINNFLIRIYYKKYLSKFSHIFCEDEITYSFLNSNKIFQTSTIGNTRKNQVLIDLENPFHDNRIEEFIKNQKTVIYGSVEKGDYNIILETINSRNDLNHIIIPHEINKKTIQYLKNRISSEYLIYSKIKSNQITNENILIIDVFGLLKKIYKYSNISYVGGGFNKGVHNTLEPSAYGNLLLFGPKHMNFSETFFFIQNGIAHSIKNKFDFEKKLNLLLDIKKSKERNLKIVQSFLKQNTENLNVIIHRIRDEIKK